MQNKRYLLHQRSKTKTIQTMSEHFVISGRFLLKLVGLILVVALLALMNVSDVAHQQPVNKVFKSTQHFSNDVILKSVKNKHENVDASKNVFNNLIY